MNGQMVYSGIPIIQKALKRCLERYDKVATNLERFFVESGGESIHGPFEQFLWTHLPIERKQYYLFRDSKFNFDGVDTTETVVRRAVQGVVTELKHEYIRKFRMEFLSTGWISVPKKSRLLSKNGWILSMNVENPLDTIVVVSKRDGRDTHRHEYHRQITEIMSLFDIINIHVLI